MRITLRTPEEIRTQGQLIAEKQKEGYVLINRIEGGDSISNAFGVQSIPSIVLEFQKF